MLLNSSPNWTDAEAVNIDYLDIQQIIPATFFSTKEGPHRLEVRRDPITVGEFLLDFPGGAMTKIFLVVKYWTAKDKRDHSQKEKKVSQAFIKNIKQESGLDDDDSKLVKGKGNALRTTLFVGREVS